MFRNYKDNLISLGLIGKEIDSSSLGLRITRIGGVLLNLINLGNDYYKSYSTPINLFEAIKISKEQTSTDILEGLKQALNQDIY